MLTSVLIAQIDTTQIRAAELPTSGNPGAPWPAIDNLNRELPLQTEVGNPKSKRFVGIFYFLWLDQHGDTNIGPFDNSKIIAENPRALYDADAPQWGPPGHYHFWSEPLFGYYHSADPWVIRRHAHLLADAGIDTLIFDATNAVTYTDVYMKLCEVFTQIRNEGSHTPQIAFMVNTHAGQTAEKIYNELYKPALYKDLWFIWQGKPLMICDPQAASDQVRNFFTLRKAHWPFELVNTPYAWHWEATYPQVFGYTDDPQQPEQVNVSAAQNLRQFDGKVTEMSRGDARGRSFHQNHFSTLPGSVNYGLNFQEQWSRALQLDPPFVMVTGWNEWIAGRFNRKGLPVAFIDQFNQQNSRDIEMMKGGHGDNYYCQLVANVRRYKGAPPLPQASGPKTIQLGNGFQPWQQVQPEFNDPDGDTLPRNHKGTGKTHYENKTGRNELLTAKIAYDENNLYFYIHTRDLISSWKDSNWMMLLIDIDANPKTGWEGFDYLINRSVISESKTWLEKNQGNLNWQQTTKLDYEIAGNQMQIVVPKSSLGLNQAAKGFTLDFKWLDNCPIPGDIMQFYVNGDVAPDGRFKYRFIVQ
ncbi:MAG: hypothetical protein JXD22_10555 [Sedimentisphaerales bacterium]|nr:hypothetical protein [Sedimentisphaerales bacterium]